MAEGSDTSDINTLRQTLIRDIYTNLKFPLTGHPECRALLWLADMDVLYDLRASTQDFDGIFHSGFDCITFTTQTAGTWVYGRKLELCGNNQQLPVLTGKTPGPNESRCLARERSICAITEVKSPVEVAYIYPLTMKLSDESHKEIEIYYFWDSLRYFFTEEKVNRWKSIALSDKDESPANMLCLSPVAHDYWAKGFIALKPVALSDDRTQLTVQFFWLDRKIRKHHTVLLTEAPEQVLNIGDRSPGNKGIIRLWNYRTREVVKSGDLITLGTDDPVEKPLPDWELLDMQWYLQLAAAAGGAKKRGDTGGADEEHFDVDTDSDTDADADAEDVDSGYSDEDHSD